MLEIIRSESIPEFADMAQDQAQFAVNGIAAEYPRGYVVPWHQHQRCHLLYATRGVMLVEAQTGKWMVPPTTAVWLRPEVPHRLIMQSAVQVHGILVAPAEARALSLSDSVIGVSNLLKALIARLVAIAADAPVSRHRQLLADLFLAELSEQQALPYHLPWPNDSKFVQLCEQLSRDPSLDLRIEQWAEQLAMSSKTFQRHFLKNTGLSFSRWRQQLRLMSALNQLIQGKSITEVALSSGYESHSAFTVAFHKHFGHSPSSFMQKLQLQSQ
ncbi:hypothetical protein BFG52_10385 [Acinetobacter larvae]|uniref:HTH araC/xylS-type domain-containing protein n=2 Tax=Acinetobacter larvae TaxID=1789224 RepID=A0A1B2M434_9GAMM|nr:hypothetical protein BFG52_10385 [Acinetobacter larvae]